MLALALVLLSVAPPTTRPAPLAANLAPNPGFEQVETTAAKPLPAEWTPFTAWGEGNAGLEATVVHSGAHAVRIQGIKPVTQCFMRTAEYQVAAGEKFEASAWVRTDHLAGDPGAVLMADFFNLDGHSDATARFAVAPAEAEGKWTRLSGTITVPPLARVMRLRVGIWNSHGTAYFDDVELHALTPLSCRIDLTSPRLTPATTSLPATLINRARQKGEVTAVVSLTGQETRQPVVLTGDPVQQVSLPITVSRRGEQAIKLSLLKGEQVLATNQRDVLVPERARLSPPIPTHWAIEDGPPAVEGDLTLALTPGEMTTASIEISLADAHQKVLSTWHSGPVADGVNTFHLNPPPLPPGTYTITARLLGAGPAPGFVTTLSRPFHVIHRADAETTLNPDGYLVHAGHPIFPLGIFNGAGKSTEMGQAGFTIQHAYNACDVVEGQEPDDDAALQFLDRAHAAGLQCLFLIPRGFVFAGDWPAFRRRVRMFRNHPALLAWDEEEGMARGDLSMSGLKQMCQILRQEDPHHPIMIGDARDEITSISDRSTLFPADLMDLGMWWWYPIPPRPGKGSLLNGDDATNAFELSPPTFLTRATTKKPIWVGVQSYKKEFLWARFPTPDEYRAQAYIALIHGAKGLMWYGGYVDGGLFTAPDSESHWPYLQELAGELRSLQDVLMAPPADAPSFEPASAPISLSLRHAPHRTVLLVANRDRRPQDVTLHLPANTPPDVNVLFESRSLPVTAGLLHDHFDPYAVHVYQLTGG